MSKSKPKVKVRLKLPTNGKPPVVPRPDDPLAQRVEEIAQAERSNAAARPGTGQHMLEIGCPEWIKPWQFKKGNTASVGHGRPASRSISEAYRRLVAETEPTTGLTFSELIALAQLRNALTGDLPAAREMREVTEGKLPDKLNLTSPGTHDAMLAEADEQDLEMLIFSYQAVRGHKTIEGKTN